MGKTLVVGDMHSKQKWILPRLNAVIGALEPDRVVFCGDYCDEHSLSDSTMLDALAFLLSWKKQVQNKRVEVTLLVGNHDMDYLLDSKFPIFCTDLVFDVCDRLESMNLQMAAEVDGILVTHAGLVESWALEYIPDVDDASSACRALNSLLDSGDLSDLIHLSECGPGRGGRGLPGPLWADKSELCIEAIPCVRQIVGHSPARTCTRKVVGTSELWLCDTFTRTRRMKAFGDGSIMLVADGAVEIVGEDFMEGLGLKPWCEVVREIDIEDSEELGLDESVGEEQV